MIIINEIMVFFFTHLFFFFFFFFFYTDYQLYIFFFINCIYCIVLIVYIVLARTCFNERFSLLNVAWLNKVLYCIVLYCIVSTQRWQLLPLVFNNIIIVIPNGTTINY